MIVYFLSELTRPYCTMSNVTRKTTCAKTNDFLVGNIYFCILIIHRNNEASDIIETNVSRCQSLVACNFKLRISIYL